MDEERLLARSMQQMGRGEMARNLHNNESELGRQFRGQQAYKWVRLLCDPSVQIENELKRPRTFQEVFDKSHKKKGTDQYITTEPERLRSHIASNDIQVRREGEVAAVRS
ncbi:hypothetical protein Taro_054947 [Colocasia esculenta]|uniref:Uncharacterized protein n=1 Tax=Colocasia esculenta TaxID=4460 RepID=A0A843XS64_COLES|nr:hypothetical protein [Colocasia esculenta]